MKEIKLGSKKYPGLVALVDDEDYEKVNQYIWHVHKKKNTYYGRTNTKKENKHQTLLMHKLICPQWKIVDHKNGNGWDNRKNNLRNGVGSLNNRNARKRENTSSKYKGVWWYKADSNWEAGIVINKKRLFLGRFSNEIEAAKVYNEAAIKYFGDYAKLNDI